MRDLGILGTRCQTVKCKYKLNDFGEIVIKIRTWSAGVIGRGKVIDFKEERTTYYVFSLLWYIRLGVLMVVMIFVLCHEDEERMCYEEWERMRFERSIELTAPDPSLIALLSLQKCAMHNLHFTVWISHGMLHHALHIAHCTLHICCSHIAH